MGVSVREIKPQRNNIVFLFTILLLIQQKEMKQKRDRNIIGEIISTLLMAHWLNIRCHVLWKPSTSFQQTPSNVTTHLIHTVKRTGHDLYVVHLKLYLPNNKIHSDQIMFIIFLHKNIGLKGVIHFVWQYEAVYVCASSQEAQCPPWMGSANNNNRW